VVADFAIEAAAREADPAGASGVGDAGTRSAASIATAANAADAASRRIIGRAAEYLGMGISYLVNLLDLEEVVLYGPMIRAGDYFIETVRRFVDTHALDSAEVSIVKSAVADDAMLKGAVLLATDGDVAERFASIWEESQ
jgi:predicted NBD/HSP70 family sugar kinase